MGVAPPSAGQKADLLLAKMSRAVANGVQDPTEVTKLGASLSNIAKDTEPDEGATDSPDSQDDEEDTTDASSLVDDSNEEGDDEDDAGDAADDSQATQATEAANATSNATSAGASLKAQMMAAMQDEINAKVDLALKEARKGV